MSKTNNGICACCNQAFSKTVMTRHLQKCPARTLEDGNERYLMIHIQARYSPEYWLHLEARAGATFTQLDDFLRNIWLDCCGHMSMFLLGDQIYSSDPDRSYGEKSMRAKIGDSLYKGLNFRHEYDMGSTTELNLKVVSERFGTKKSASAAIELLARNVAPDIRCAECGNKQAEDVCSECQYDGTGWLCASCSENHECGEEMLLPVVNSPRVGVCGYTG